MPVYDQGGGGGKAGSGVTDKYALSKPYTIQGGVFTAAMAQRIDQMFDTLFKSLVRAETKTTSLQSQVDGITTSDVLISTLNLSNADIGTLGTAPVIHIAGQTGKIIVPIWWVLEWNTTVAYTSAPNWTLRPDTGSVVDIFTTSTSRLNEVRHAMQVMSIISTGYIYNTADDLEGAGLEIGLSANPTGAGTATAVSKLGYHVITAAY